MKARGRESREHLALRLLESRIDISADDAPLLAQLGRCFEGAGAGSDHEAGDVDLSLQLRRESPETSSASPRFHVTTEPAGALEHPYELGPRDLPSLTRALVQWSVTNATHHYVFHAGAVALDGRGILLPAGPYGGKTTLTVGLAKRGFALLSDEVGAIDLETGRLVGFPRALSIRADVLSILGLHSSIGLCFEDEECRILGPGELGVRRANRDAQPSLIVVPAFEAGAATRMERLATGSAITALLQASCSQPRFKEAGLDFAIELARCVPCFRLRFSNLQEALDRIEVAFVELVSPGVRSIGAPRGRKISIDPRESTRADRPHSVAGQTGSPDDDSGTGVPIREIGRGGRKAVELSARPALRGDLVLRDVDGDFVVYDPISDRLVVLNVSAAFIFDLCDGTRTPDEIAAEVASVLEDEPNRVSHDVENTLEKFAALGMLQIGATSG